MKLELTLTALLLAPQAPLHAADATTKAEKPKAPAPFVYDGNPERRKYELPVEPDENVAYGTHRMQVIYFWRAKSDKPTLLADRPAKVGGWSVCYPTLTELADGTLVAIWAQIKSSPGELYGDIHSARIVLKK